MLFHSVIVRSLRSLKDADRRLPDVIPLILFLCDIIGIDRKLEPASPRRLGDRNIDSKRRRKSTLTYIESSTEPHAYVGSTPNPDLDNHNRRKPQRHQATDLDLY